ncbi:MAG: hypothetical protein A3G32_04860 [Deltaproteobacteria bacterium RIFCSPLOWO2_12_FULL_40_28]|nr:MAG: hypothetical protein A3C45_08970 [Deltaproteobacteria bacterium RIFCSPHIGHO2_02_FULL_40_28]OGQ19698.1 MAG: hypothetical protein A3E27_08165 [Deltaproteobacteria bacterium RIFCSPHIGHO2_12_FULL_40_32]OGQ40975.1 MAG: hypothetical protein A3I69_03580 [Deltaproteobacteria bacterium RIFCSPLOWO2_02_FULL_40_36]OGQ54090.1 MAG: hypothetical protein A3G32_04860 [Deltaproteobacteria bacterium RIFCSPLOWO2_12_FULL_40_28]
MELSSIRQVENFQKKGESMKFHSFLAVALFVIFSTISCGGSDSSSSSGTAGRISGTVTSPNGDPVSGATVWIPSTSSTATKVLQVNSKVKGLTDGDGESCSDPSSTASDSDCSSATGAFTVECSGTGSQTVNFAKGSFTGDTTVNCGSNASASSTQFSTDDAPEMAVVTGSYDRIQDVLAKLGYGTVDSSGLLDTTQTFQFTLIDGDSTLDSTYTDLSTFVSSVDNLNAFDIIFINCGADDSVITDSSVVARFQSYVQNGGKLYVTDLSYDFIEQPFPDFMDFKDGGSDAATAETMDAAQDGTSGISSDATVNDTDMAAWLDAVTVNTGDVETCSLTTVNGTTGARNSDDTVTIADFLSGWAVMEAAHTGESPTIWIQGPIEYTGGSDSDAPLTVTKTESSGKLLYSSYHTADTCPSTGFWAQERILQYLVFEL